MTDSAVRCLVTGHSLAHRGAPLASFPQCVRGLVHTDTRREDRVVGDGEAVDESPGVLRELFALAELIGDE